MSDRLLALPLVVLLVPALAPPTLLRAAEPTCHDPLARPPIAGESIGLVYGADIAREVVEEAITIWRSCPNSRGDFPTIVHGPSTAVITVELDPGNSGSKRCGYFRGRNIRLYRWARTSDHSLRSCGSLALNLAHELGHALGLADAHELPACTTTIMADLETGNLFRRAVSAEECRLAGERWRTLAELALDEAPPRDAPSRAARLEAAEAVLQPRPRLE